MNRPAAQEAAPVTPARHTPANPAVWVFVLSEMSEFAFFFIAFLLVKFLNPGLFGHGAERLAIWAGFINTILLITSSWFVARGVQAMKSNGERHRTAFWLALTIGAALLYCAVKYLEYLWNLEHGITIRGDLFYSLYYYLTFNHLLHVLIGICVIGWAPIQTLLGAYDRRRTGGLEGAAIYWHMIDLVWILLFPMIYIVG